MNRNIAVKENLKREFGRSMLWYWVSYFVVTMIGVGHTIFNVAVLHMGSMAVIGANAPKNLVHVVINNGAHETVGGMPTVASAIDLVAIAKGCGYPRAVCVDSFEALDRALEDAKAAGDLSLIEVRCSIGARDDLGRPTTTALENKEHFMAYLKTL